MRAALFWFQAMFLLAACAQTEQLQITQNSKWVGKNADEFFIKYSSPYSSQELSDGRKLYLWQNAVTSHHPGSVMTTVSPSIGGGIQPVYVDTTAIQPTTTTMGCRVQLLVSKTNIIQEFTFKGDTMGLWNFSRCTELFENS